MRQSVYSNATITAATYDQSVRRAIRSCLFHVRMGIMRLLMSSYPGYSVTYLAGTTDGSSLAMACAQGFATFAGVDLYLTPVFGICNETAAHRPEMSMRSMYSSRVRIGDGYMQWGPVVNKYDHLHLPVLPASFSAPWPPRPLFAFFSDRHFTTQRVPIERHNHSRSKACGRPRRVGSLPWVP